MKNNLLIRQLTSYSTLAASFVAFTNDVKAQIIYTDIIPDDTLRNCDTLAVDLNNDGISDFVFGVSKNLFNYWHGCFIMNEENKNQVAGQLGPSYQTGYGSSSHSYFKLPYNLKSSDRIDSALRWVTPLPLNKFKWCNGNPMTSWKSEAIFNFYGMSTGFLGNWRNGLYDEGYVGLKTFVQGKAYYGWVRLSVDTAANWMIIKDYAIDTIPEESLLAGQGIVTGSHLAFQNNTLLFPNPASDHFKLVLPDRIIPQHVTAIDELGRREDIPFVSTGDGIVADVSSFSKGLYLIEVKCNDVFITKRIIIE